MNVTGSGSDGRSRRTARGRHHIVRPWLLAGLAVLALGSCGGSDASDDAVSSDPTTAVAPDDPDTLTVGELLDREDQGRSGHNVVVVAMLLDDGTGMRMCEALAESFPPQCGEPSIEVMNPDAIDVELTEAQGVRWSDASVELLGWVEDDAFVVT